VRAEPGREGEISVCLELCAATGGRVHLRSHPLMPGPLKVRFIGMGLSDLLRASVGEKAHANKDSCPKTASMTTSPAEGPPERGPIYGFCVPPGSHRSVVLRARNREHGATEVSVAVTQNESSLCQGVVRWGRCGGLSVGVVAVVRAGRRLRSGSGVA